MGYQESYVRVKNSEKFEELISLTKIMGRDFFHNIIYAKPYEIITLTKPIQGNLDFMCHPEIEYNFDVGERFLYFCGERSGQRNATCMYDSYAPKDLEIYFTESFPSDKIFDKNSGYAKHEKFSWD